MDVRHSTEIYEGVCEIGEGEGFKMTPFVEYYMDSDNLTSIVHILRRTFGNNLDRGCHFSK